MSDTPPEHPVVSLIENWHGAVMIFRLGDHDEGNLVREPDKARHLHKIAQERSVDPFVVDVSRLDSFGWVQINEHWYDFELVYRALKDIRARVRGRSSVTYNTPSLPNTSKHSSPRCLHLQFGSYHAIIACGIPPRSYGETDHE